MTEQMPLFLKGDLAALMPEPELPEGVEFEKTEVDLSAYDRLIVCLSGKDAIACFLRLIDLGVDLSKVELWHHDVDGREGSTLADWPFMASYCRAFADAFGVPIYFSWLEGGFEGEMLKENSVSGAHMVETPDGLVRLERNSKPGTRLKFPQVSASLTTRWCSSALKIDVARRAITNQERFTGQRTLFITGERREESAGRSKYNQFEPHYCSAKKRQVDHWRPVLHLDEQAIWDLLRKHRVVPPVPYRLGWPRSSCQTCIFNSDSIWATIGLYFPDRLERIDAYERQFGVSIARSGKTVAERAAGAEAFEITDNEALVQARSKDYFLPVLLEPGQEWVMPPGAFGNEGCGAV
jgi:3'-phosphoadenosine 5'-phosphosulfate sulfotransferase (PAPS reductase)/FAD synthetase